MKHAIMAVMMMTTMAKAMSNENRRGDMMKIWPVGNPDGWTHSKKETSATRGGVTRIGNVNDPTLTHYSPVNRANGKAVVVCPGGGYSILAIDKEGSEIAQWLSANGYHAFVLKYRLPRKGVDKVRYVAALQDAQRAISIVRSRAGELKLKKVGIMGFSAGGHLSATTACNHAKRAYKAVDAVDKASCRPDFVGLIYPAYLVKNKGNGTLAREVAIPENMPPVFFVQTSDDGIPVENSLFFYRALKNKRVDAELHIFPKGGHGYGMRKADMGDRALAAWPDLYLKWLDRQ